MQKVSKIAVLALSGLFCGALTTHAGAQSTSSMFSFTGVTNESGSFSFVGAAPAFNTSLGTLTGVEFTEITMTQNTSLTLTNSTASNETATITQNIFNNTIGDPISASLPGIGDFAPIVTGSVPVPANSTATFVQSFTDGPKSQSSETLLTASQLALFEGSSVPITIAGGVGTTISGGPTYTETVPGGPTETISGTVTYFYTAPVPELSSSIGLMALVLGGSALGLRARRRARA